LLAAISWAAIYWAGFFMQRLDHLVVSGINKLFKSNNSWQLPTTHSYIGWV